MGTFSYGNFVPMFQIQGHITWFEKAWNKLFKGHFSNETFDLKEYRSRNICSGTVCFQKSLHPITESTRGISAGFVKG